MYLRTKEGEEEREDMGEEELAGGGTRGRIKSREGIGDIQRDCDGQYIIKKQDAFTGNAQVSEHVQAGAGYHPRRREAREEGILSSFHSLGLH